VVLLFLLELAEALAEVYGVYALEVVCLYWTLYLGDTALFDLFSFFDAVYS